MHHASPEIHVKHVAMLQMSVYTLVHFLLCRSDPFYLVAHGLDSMPSSQRGFRMDCQFPGGITSSPVPVPFGSGAAEQASFSSVCFSRTQRLH